MNKYDNLFVANMREKESKQAYTIDNIINNDKEATDGN